jgi:polynucleotide 5'-triphosphatase
MEDRENSVEQSRNFEQHDVKPQVNGEHRSAQLITSSPQQPARKRIRYTEPPIWAQSVRNKGSFPGAGNRVLSKVNGKQPAPQLQPQKTPPPLVKSETNGHQQMPVAVNRPGPQLDVGVDDPSVLLGPWERSIAGNKPHDAIAKAVADWLYEHVVCRQDIGELSSRGVEVEIEAKLGQLVDKDHGVRYQLPVKTEVVLPETNRIGFRSSMSEVRTPILFADAS